MKTKMLSLVLLGLIATVFASTVFEYVTARSEEGRVRVEWKSQGEDGTVEYCVERKTVQGDFMTLGKVAAKGGFNKYFYYDESLLKGDNVLQTYRIKAIDKTQGYIYSKEVTVSNQISGIRRTWGSIKAMFR